MSGLGEILFQRTGSRAFKGDLKKMEDKVEYTHELERKRSAALLFFGSAFGLLGFVFAFVIGIITFVNPMISNFHKSFESGNGYFPATVSEMVHDPTQPAGKCFFAFEFIGAIFIFMSWYPWEMRNVYIGDDECVPGTKIFGGLSWMMFRQFVPPAGMMLVACVTTTPFAQATILDYYCISIHLTGAVMLFGGYALVEAVTIGMGVHLRTEQTKRFTENKIKPLELKCRRFLLLTILFWYCIFCALTGILMLPPSWLGMSNDSVDTWKEKTVQDVDGDFVPKMVLANTASGGYLFLKIVSYVSEVFTGLALIASFFTIWFFCDERKIDLQEHLDSVNRPSNP